MSVYKIDNSKSYDPSSPYPVVLVSDADKNDAGLNPTDPENPNFVYAGPASGSAAIPQFRALVMADMPQGVGSGGPIPESQVTNLVSDLAAKAADSSVVHNTGNETVAGLKTFTGGITVGGVVDFAASVVHIASNGQYLFAVDNNTLYWYTGLNGIQFTNAGNTANIGALTNIGNFSVAGSVTGNSVLGGEIILTRTLSDANAAINSFYRGSDHSNSLCWKNGSGTVTVVAP